MTKLLILIFIANIWGNVGQILYKKSANNVDTPNLHSLSSYLGFIGRIVAMPTIWIGLASIAVGMFVWIIALAHANLSLAFPLDSMQYIVTLVTAYIFLNERINRWKLIGTSLVVGGIILVALS